MLIFPTRPFSNISTVKNTSLTTPVRATSAGIVTAGRSRNFGGIMASPAGPPAAETETSGGGPDGCGSAGGRSDTPVGGGFATTPGADSVATGAADGDAVDEGTLDEGAGSETIPGAACACGAAVQVNSTVASGASGFVSSQVPHKKNPTTMCRANDIPMAVQ